jgi:hypothetical protein
MGRPPCRRLRWRGSRPGPAITDFRCRACLIAIRPHWAVREPRRSGASPSCATQERYASSATFVTVRISCSSSFSGLERQRKCRRGHWRMVDTASIAALSIVLVHSDCDFANRTRQPPRGTTRLRLNRDTLVLLSVWRCLSPLTKSFTIERTPQPGRFARG